MFADSALYRFVDAIDGSPWGAATGRHPHGTAGSNTALGYSAQPLYTLEQKRRRDSTVWTTVQGFLAPVQFLVFLVSLGLVLHFLLTGAGERAATASILAKTLCLYTIMVTGALWEREVFGQYLFAPAFFWEDAVSMLVIALHTFYLVGLLSGSVDNAHLMLVALVAYSAYLLNAAQFVIKLRAARKLGQSGWPEAHCELRPV